MAKGGRKVRFGVLTQFFVGNITASNRDLEEMPSANLRPITDIMSTLKDFN